MSLRSIRKLLGFETKSKVVARLMDNRKRTAFLIYAQTLCTTPHKSQIYTLSCTQVYCTGKVFAHNRC